MKKPSQAQYLTPRQVAVMWGVNYETILRRIASGDIKVLNVAPKGSNVQRYRIPAAEANRPGMVKHECPKRGAK